MAESGLIDCPHCGELVESGVACSDCGEDISEVAPAPAEDPKPHGPRKDLNRTQEPFASRASADVVSDSEEIERDLSDARTVANAQSVTEALAQEAADLGEITEADPFADADPDPEVSDLGDCPHFRLEFNDARICVQGWMTSFNFRLVAMSEESGQCRMPKVEVCIHGEKPVQKTVWGALLKGRKQNVDFNFTSQCLGYEISSEVQLTYSLNGHNHAYSGGFMWDAVSPDTPSAKLIENLVIKMDGVEAGMAADQNINILEGFKGQENRSMLEAMQELKRLRPVWKCIELNDVMEASVPVPKGLKDRLTLVGPGEMRLHLLGGTRFSMGRAAAAAACDITTMLFRGSDQPDPKLTLKNGVSRFQAHVVYRGGQWELRDGGIDSSASFARVKPSTFGTFLDGQKIASRAEVLKSGVEHMVTFAKRPNQDKHVFGFEATVLHDPDTRQPSALLLERIDSVRECFLCLAGKIDLDELMPGSGAGVLRFRKGGFKLTKASGEQWLKPDLAINHSWSCEAHRQLGL